MRLRTIVGASMSEALARVQKELGPDALVLETRSSDGATEVVAADVEREEPTDGLMRLRAEVALLRRELSLISGGPGRLAAAPSPGTAAPPENARLAPLAVRLRGQGVAEPLVRRILDLVANGPAKDGRPIDPRTHAYTMHAVAGVLPGMGPPAEKSARCFALVGPPGAGKTTTLAKLAEQRAAKGDRNFAILTLDGDRPGGSELIAKLADRLGIAFAAVRGSLDLAKALDVVGRPRLILIDTAGLGARESAALDVLRENLQHGGGVVTHLVLPAHLEEQAMLAAAAAFKPLGPSSLVFTKLDETVRTGSLINAPVALELPIAALAHGRSLAGDLAPATRKLVAEIVLGIRPPNLGSRALAAGAGGTRT